MIALIQRVSHAEVSVQGETVARIGSGLLVLLGAEMGDTRQSADRLLQKTLSYRIFADGERNPPTGCCKKHCLTASLPTGSAK